MTGRRKTKVRGLRVLAAVAGASLLLCIVGAGLSALSNRNLPSDSQETAQLDPLDKARLAETLHLKGELGENVWPGWGKTEIPVVIWNRDHSFLVGYLDLPPPWEPVPGDLFQERTYMRRPTGEPQNFSVRVGDRWVASMATKWEVDAYLIDMIRDVLPSPLKPIIPYRLLIQPSEVQMVGVLHETFHVYQAQVASKRLDEAEVAHGRGEQYWQADGAMHAEWREEIDLLARALKAQPDEKATALAREYLEQRAHRRAAVGLSAALIDYERQLEWEEGLPTSSIPVSWGALGDSAGVSLLEDLSDRAVRRVKQSTEAVVRPGDLVVISVHWGSNWGYSIPPEQVAFAHRLIDDAGVDVVHGHSSHHVKGIEVYKGRPVLYGCGDLTNDHEGISGYEQFRGDLALVYLFSVDPSTGKLTHLEMTPMQIRNLRANRASRADALWLRDTLNREGKQFGTRVEMDQAGTLTLRWD